MDADNLRKMDGAALRRLRRSMNMELPEFRRWLAEQLGETSEATPFFHANGKPLWLANLYSGSAFLVCGGPSLKTLDLSKLRSRGVWTLAINNAGCLFRPNAMLHVDPCDKFHDALWLDPYVTKFCPTGMKQNTLRHKEKDGTFVRLGMDGAELKAHQMPNVVFYQRSPCYDPDKFLTETEINWGVSKKWWQRTKRTRILNSFIAAIKVLYVLGFRVVYLVGADFNMSSAQPYAFSQGGDNNKAQSNNNCYQIMDGMFQELRPRFESAEFYVFNTNPDSRLTAFDFVSYDEAIRTATKFVPQEPLDTSGWYERTIGKVGGG